MTPRLKGAITSSLRRLWRTSDGYEDALAAAKKSYTVQSKHGKAMRRVHFGCATCGQFFGRDDVHVDHVEPIVLACGFETWDKFIDRLFFGKMQILCEHCHGVKTKIEQAERAEVRRALKPSKPTKRIKKSK